MVASVLLSAAVTLSALSSPKKRKKKKSLSGRVNEHNLVAVNSLVIKSFERIIQSKPLDNLQGYLDPAQFAYSDATGALST